MAQRFWLMKTEPDSFGIDDLQRVKIEPWTGVRNFMARNYMRDEMQVGDGVLFYHSNAEPSGVAGLGRVHRTGVVDDTQFEPSSKYYDPKAKRDAPTWICVDVSFVEKFPRLVALSELHGEARLAGMLVIRKGMRLSVMPVEQGHYEVVKEMSGRPAPKELAEGDRPAKGVKAKAKAKPAAKATAKAKAKAKPAAKKAAPKAKAKPAARKAAPKVKAKPAARSRR